MRRATAFTLIVLMAILLVAMVAQLNQPAPSTPFPGPTNGSGLPATPTASASA
jgi:hypothetical protein